MNASLIIYSISLLLFMTVESVARRICTEGCPDVPSLNSTFITIPQLRYLHAMFTNNEDLLESVKAMNCTTSYVTWNRRLGVALTEVISYTNRNNESDSYTTSSIYNCDHQDFTQFNGISNQTGAFVSNYLSSYIYSAEPYAVGYQCFPISQNDTSKCFYVWMLIGTTKDITENCRGNIIYKIEALGLDVNPNNTAYYSHSLDVCAKSSCLSEQAQF